MAVRASGRGRALGLVAFWSVVGVASYVLGVTLELGQQAEESVLDAAEFTTNPPAPLSLVSPVSVLIAVAVAGIVALIAYGIGRALLVTLVPLAAVAASQLLKQRWLERPDFIEFDAVNTFPSGHMTVAAAVVAAFVWAAPARWRAVVGLLGAGIMSVFAWQLLAFRWHRPSDLFGALALVLVAFSVVMLVRPVRTMRQAGGFERASSRILSIAGWLLVAAALALLAFAVIRSEPERLLLTGEIGTVGAALIAVRGMLLLSGS